MTKIAWPLLMRAGLRGLGLQPAQFWALTPAEFQVKLGLGADSAPIARIDLAALQDAYPDTRKDDCHV